MAHDENHQAKHHKSGIDELDPVNQPSSGSAGQTIVSQGDGTFAYETPAGGFEIRIDDPATPTEGDVWYNSTDKQFKGYNGTEVVILG